MGRALFLGALMALVPALAGGQNDALQSYQGSLARLCPVKHLEWLSAGELDDLIEVNFHDALPQSQQQKLDAAYSRERELCANVAMGLACYNVAHIRAMSDVNLLSRFTRMVCDSGLLCRAPAECGRQ